MGVIDPKGHWRTTRASGHHMTWVSTHIPKAELVLPPSTGEWKQPLGRVNLSFLHHFLHTKQPGGK